jgi:UDP-N-acetyl-D-mannosaminuronic acid dehydrogenase
MKRSFERISVIGLGYIGLPTAAVIASRGIQVIGVDINEKTVATINQGKIHIVEPELDVLVRGAVNAGNLKAVLSPEPADAFLIAVPTPVQKDHAADLSYIQAAAKSLAPVLEKGNLVILESTSPVGTTDQLMNWIKELRPDLKLPNGVMIDDPDIHIAYCPERVLPGQVLRELVDNDRVIGGVTPKCSQRARELYSTFVQAELRVTTTRTAELVKLTENAFRDTNIAFANELSLICDNLDINVWELIELANLHPRVNILQPGAGVGGHCIAVDPWFIVHSCPERAKMIRTAREINEGKPKFVVERVKERAERFKDPVIACLGLAFKPNIDDLRESPALQIVQDLAKENIGKILAVEPNIPEIPEELKGYDQIHFDHLGSALEQADIVVVLVKHKEFEELQNHHLSEKIVLDFVDALKRR